MGLLFSSAVHADRTGTIERVKGSVVAVGTFERLRSPAFQFLATGFAVADGTLIVTNAHVLPAVLDSVQLETIAVLVVAKGGKDPAQVREAKQLVVDTGSDLALLKITGPALPPMKVRGSATIGEGQEILFTGYPIGAILGPYPATHRGIVSASTLIAIPQRQGGSLDPRIVHRLNTGPFPVFQLDATAYPGNSGSPLYDPESGEVLGVVNMVFIKATKEAALTQPSGITYAIPSSHLLDLLQRAR